IGILIDSANAMTASAMPRPLLNVTFEAIRDGSVTGAVSFTDSLTAKGISDAAGNSLTTRYFNGNIVLSGKRETTEL
ncbi:MAG: hypothetical protein KA810_08180, partial [Pyrinomonadaceae bacterium]|nr:hypothetical protein [Pyrinomonadaceae bacterium]